MSEEETEENLKIELQKFFEIYNLPAIDRIEKHYAFLRQFVLENPLFSTMKLDLNNEELDKLVAMVKFREITEPTCIYRRGDAADCLYLVQAGRVYMTVENPDH